MGSPPTIQQRELAFFADDNRLGVFEREGVVALDLLLKSVLKLRHGRRGLKSGATYLGCDLSWLEQLAPGEASVQVDASRIANRMGPRGVSLCNLISFCVSLSRE